MNIINILLAPFILFIVFCILLFFHYLIKNILLIRKFEKKIQLITLEYDAFLIRKFFAETQKIAYSEPFAIKYKTDTVIVTTNNVSQATCLSSLIILSREIDSMIDNFPESTKATASIAECIDAFNSIKEGINEANPYR